ncbi:MAG: selenocysteine-specific translation elongation factor, partial [Dehalococcoidales bacterium]|nr:selenocysteine-specific translation elongation factor [Dehalococcoidales bacterium]
MFVLGTAGHIDHGKSALVQALTGVDPDRLAEEKKRGMTIDLGFAWLKLPGGPEIGIVDVPGHERFVRNMLAGAGGIDIAMLVIAANEGIMPQTREHLAILDLLGISRGLVALTKQDLVDAEWLDLIKMEVEELLKPTTLAGAPIVPVSAITREGLPELLSTISSLLQNAHPRPDKGRPRLPIDRVFSIAGAGTIVTGTLLDGSLTVGQEAEIVPSGVRAKIRGLQSHKSGLDHLLPGSRAAVNLMNVNTDDIPRGEILTSPGWLIPSTVLSARLRVLADARRPLPHNAERNIYILAAEAVAKIRLLETDEIKPGQNSLVQLILDRPLAIVDGDHFVIRSTGETLGGGVIIDAHAARLPRFKPEILEKLRVREKGSPEDLVMGLLSKSRTLGLVDIIKGLPLEKDVIVQSIQELLNRGLLIPIGDGDAVVYYSLPGWQHLQRDAKAALAEYHLKYPLRSGMPAAELVKRLKLGKTAPLVFSRWQHEKVLVADGATLRLPEFTVKLNPSQNSQIDAFLKSLAANPYAPLGDNI